MTSIEDMNVRRAREGDLEALLRLMAAFNRVEQIPFRRTGVAEGLRLLLRRRRLGVVLVAERLRRLDGYAGGTFGFDLEFAGPDAFLTELYVRPQSRRLGVGALLLDAITTALRDGGANAVTLLVRHENRGARKLYARGGFEELPRIAMLRRTR